MPVVQIAVKSTGDQAAASTRAEVVHMAGQMDVGESETGPMTDEQVEDGAGDGGEQGSLNVDICKTETVTETHSMCENVCNVIRTPDDQNVVSHVVAYTVIENNPSNVTLDMQPDALPDKDTNTQTVEIENTLTTELSSESPTNITREMVNHQQQQQTDKRTNGRSSGKAAKKEKPTPFKKKDSMAKETLHPNSPTPLSTERCDSSLSNTSMDQCRICQCDSCEIQTDSPLVSPCVCSGSLKFIHQACLQKWIKSSDKMSCELCQFEYQMTKKTKPFREWERLDMTPAERRKVMCSVTFHVIAITCVVWSLYVLIDRTTEEVEAGSLLWPFWTKLIVVAIGFTGGVVFMYVQCKMYLTLCKKWRMYNKVILISSISDAQREKANQEGLLKIKEKQKQLEEGRETNLDVFNIVNETESV